METDRVKGVRLWELRTTSCRWPLGERWDHVEFFCGEPIIRGCSWCKEHRARAFVRAWVRGADKAPITLKDRRR